MTQPEILFSSFLLYWVISSVLFTLPTACNKDATYTVFRNCSHMTLSTSFVYCGDRHHWCRWDLTKIAICIFHAVSDWAHWKGYTKKKVNKRLSCHLSPSLLLYQYHKWKLLHTPYRSRWVRFKNAWRHLTPRSLSFPSLHNKTHFSVQRLRYFMWNVSGWLWSPKQNIV